MSLSGTSCRSTAIAVSSREELVSTMDAERALRIQRVEVPRIKALAIREGPILFSEGKGKPYVIDPVAVKVLL